MKFVSNNINYLFIFNLTINTVNRYSRQENDDEQSSNKKKQKTIKKDTDLVVEQFMFNTPSTHKLSQLFLASH